MGEVEVNYLSGLLSEKSPH